MANAVFEQVVKSLSPLEELGKTLQSAEAALVKAQSATQRLAGVRFSLNTQITKLNAEIRQLRVEVFEQMALENVINARPLFETIDRLRGERKRLLDSMSYVASFAFEEAAIREMESEIAEREATAKLFEGQAIDMRNRALQAAGAAAAIDPGFTLNVKDAKSQRLLETAQQIWRTVDQLKERLRAKKAAVADEQNAVAPGLFNS